LLKIAYTYIFIKRLREISEVSDRSYGIGGAKINGLRLLKMAMQFPVYFWLGAWQIHPHFLFESLAYAIAFRLLLWSKHPDTITPSQRSSVVVGGMVGALLGAKILVLLQHIYLVTENWQQLLLLFLQGKTVVGALLGGIIGVEWTKKLIGVTRSTGDNFVYPLIVGTAVGRVGCFLTGLSDRTYGIATSLPWGIDFGDGISRHPAQLYEIVFLVGLACFLPLCRRYFRQEGDLFKFYAIAYLGFRFLIDFIKPDFHPFFGVSAIQIACFLGLCYYFHNIQASKPQKNANS
jgi:prolipoprotein diacylglyceryltransferase